MVVLLFIVVKFRYVPAGGTSRLHNHCLPLFTLWSTDLTHHQRPRTRIHRFRPRKTI